jgi:CHAT domain-containing protein
MAMLTIDRTMGRAEASRHSVQSMITTGKDYEAPPALWARFVLVGEGGPSR